MGINAANASEGLLRSAFGRFMDAGSFAAQSNISAFDRQRGALSDSFQRQVQLAGLPASLAAAFQNLSTSGLGNATSLAGLGLDTAGMALNTATASANARIGSGSNIANFMSNRSATPALDALGSFFSGQTRPTDSFANVFRGTRRGEEIDRFQTL
jgi:hypothetical protein